MTIDIWLDFEDATPQTEKEKEIHSQVAEVLNKAEQILEKLAAYKGCEEFIRAAISKPSEETDKAAWNAILPAVETLQEFYEFSVEVEKIYPRLLTSLFQAEDDSLKSNLKGQQSLAKQLADIFDFALRFDDKKMLNPGIQNDFSYYRRTLSRIKMTNKGAEIKIKDELANRMSLFFAYPTPMMKVLTDTTVNFLKNEPCPINKAQVVAGYSLMANVCLDMVERGRFTNVKTNMFCLRGMTGSIVLVDHLDPLGAFHKKSVINVKGAITKLKNFQEDATEGLINALRYTTVHLNDADTPPTIKLLLQ
jgi:hypothetical protein